MCRRARVECAERRSRDGVAGGAETVGHETREKRERRAGGRESRVRVGWRARGVRLSFVSNRHTYNRPARERRAERGGRGR